MEQTQIQPRYLSQQDAMKWLDVTRPTLIKLEKTHKLPCIRLGGLVRYDRVDIENYMAGKKN